METTDSVETQVATGLGFVWGTSPAVHALNTMVMELARTRIPVLLTGESGTGKEIYARVIHRLSGGEPEQFRKVSCAGLEARHFAEEIERIGWAESASAVTTLFLDEIDELGAECQKILLMAAPDGEFCPKQGKVRARLISATTTKLAKEVESARFRRELYFRIDGAGLVLPPLRERKEDLWELTDQFLERHGVEGRKDKPVLKEETRELFLAYHWPGNIRELENVARKMVALGDVELATSDLRAVRVIPAPGSPQGKISSLKVAAREASRQTERELILGALERTKWNRKRAARELQISYKSLLYKLKQIETPGSKREG